MTKISVYWDCGECKSYCDEHPGILGFGKDENGAVGDLAIKLGLITVELTKKIPAFE